MVVHLRAAMLKALPGDGTGVLWLYRLQRSGSVQLLGASVWKSLPLAGGGVLDATDRRQVVWQYAVGGDPSPVQHLATALWRSLPVPDDGGLDDHARAHVVWQYTLGA